MGMLIRAVQRHTFRAIGYGEELDVGVIASFGACDVVAEVDEGVNVANYITDVSKAGKRQTDTYGMPCPKSCHRSDSSQCRRKRAGTARHG